MNSRIPFKYKVDVQSRTSFKANPSDKKSLKRESLETLRSILVHFKLHFDSYVSS